MAIHPENAECLVCFHRLVPSTAWNAASLTERWEMGLEGYRMHAARSLCRACYYSALRHGTLPPDRALGASREPIP